jgi:hypothetical protein
MQAQLSSCEAQVEGGAAVQAEAGQEAAEDPAG